MGGGDLLSATAGGSLAENTECNNSDIKGSHCRLPLICKFEGRRYKFALLEMRRVVTFGEKVECRRCRRAGSGCWIAGNLSASWRGLLIQPRLASNSVLLIQPPQGRDHRSEPLSVLLLSMSSGNSIILWATLSQDTLRANTHSHNPHCVC